MQILSGQMDPDPSSSSWRLESLYLVLARMMFKSCACGSMLHIAAVYSLFKRPFVARPRGRNHATLSALMYGSLGRRHLYNEVMKAVFINSWKPSSERGIMAKCFAQRLPKLRAHMRTVHVCISLCCEPSLYSAASFPVKLGRRCSCHFLVLIDHRVTLVLNFTFSITLHFSFELESVTAENELCVLRAWARRCLESHLPLMWPQSSMWVWFGLQSKRRREKDKRSTSSMSLRFPEPSSTGGFVPQLGSRKAQSLNLDCIPGIRAARR